MKTYQMIINGENIGENLPVVEVNNPATGKVIATVPKGGAGEAASAVDAAYEAFKEWSKLSAYERSELIRNWHDLIKDNTEDLARTMTGETGKPCTLS
jgi:succinate-semialdehyde dehydrogenase / glutarate-semialdehyde dehydrogenase